MEEAKTEVLVEPLEELEPVIDELERLYFDSYKGLEEYAYNAPSSVRRYLRWLFRHDPNGFFLAKDADGRILGFVAGDAGWISRGRKVGEIHEIVVSPEARGRGVAKRLIDTILDYFRKKGLKISGLWVGEHNKDAKRLYEKLGYRELYTKGIWVRMEKNL